MLEPGDQLPRVREVAESLAINPNTVLAYRELEHDGLVEGRPGQGTFVLGSLAGPSLASQVEVRQEVLAWRGRTRAAGLDTEDVVALFETTLRAAAEEGVA
jgi:DNA-binding transcriptional regulator YhcF (GntR family)